MHLRNLTWLGGAISQPIKNPLFLGGGFVVLHGFPEGRCKESDDDLLSQARCLLSLARERFTVLFGMGRGGSTLLWSSDIRVGGERFGCSSQHSFCLVCLAILRSLSRLLYVTLAGAGVSGRRLGLKLHRAHTLHCFSKL